MILTPITGFPLVVPGDDLAALILAGLTSSRLQLAPGDILVLASKIVSKAEGRFVDLNTVKPSARALDLAQKIEKDARVLELILRESNEVLRTRPGTIVVEHRLGFVCANAGIDHSNVRGEGEAPGEWVLLLPENPDESAQNLRRRLQAASGMPLGVLIIDSHGRAWRTGTAGVAIGIAGLPGLLDLRGYPDLFGYNLRVTQVGVADELAAAASLMMGQAAEGTPVIHVRGFPYPLREAQLAELLRAKETDLFR
jgi:coenzyme F420-0:L-glutamate ligase/coenzyme F420-1:gamma-L-glutamate ligase